MRRAFAEFLAVPTSIIAAFLALAAITFAIDREHATWAGPVRAWLRSYVFADAKATGDLLGTIAAGLITITSITISLLLIALQQSASALTHQVYDQFLRNWRNQAYFGVFVGLSLYTLVTLSSVGPLNPVIGGTVALSSIVVALFLLLVLFYTTVDQMRPVVIIDAIHTHALAARERQRKFLQRTRRVPTLARACTAPLTVERHGFVTGIDLAAVEAAVGRAREEDVEVVMRVSLGAYVVFGQPIADVVARSQDTAIAVAHALGRAIRCERKRDITSDPLHAIDELETIGWTSISTAQSDADAGVMTIYSLRDILARWSTETPLPTDARTVPLVYRDDAVSRVLDAFESLAVSASESMQHQSCAEVLRTFALLLDRLGSDERAHVEAIVLRMLSALGDHVLTAELDAALAAVTSALDGVGARSSAKAVAAASQRLGHSIGRLGGRATRAN